MTSDDDPVDALAESFLAALRRGESPSVEEYVQRQPAYAERILALFPTLEALERVSREIDPQTEAAIPERLGEYRIVRKIGRGGMGTVYEAVQEPLGRHVALKVMASGPHSHPTILERFQREARTAARLHHGNIVPVFGVGVDRGVYFFAMQFIAGQSLENVIAEIVRLRGGGSTVGESSATWLSGSEGMYHNKVAELMAQVADALAYAHGRGVLHRDVKPANLLLDDKGTVWIADFGLAKEALDDNLTTTGDVLGTLRYLPPERLRGIADERGDIYSLGATLYELATLSPVFDAKDRPALVRQVAVGDFVAPRHLDPNMSADFETVILKSLAREPASRYQSAAELADDLRNIIADRPIRARRLSAIARIRRWAKHNPLVAGLTAAVALLIGTVAMISTLSSFRLGQSLADTQRAERRANEKVLDALIAQADATRRSQQPGQRTDTIRILQEAARRADALGIKDRDDQMRDLALAALAFPDMAVKQRIVGGFPSGVDISSDASHTIYALSDATGVHIRRWNDQAEIRWFRGVKATLVRLTRDGRFLATWLPNESCQIFDLQATADRAIAEFSHVYRFHFHPRGNFGIAIHVDGTMTVCDLPSGVCHLPIPAVGVTREVGVALHPHKPWAAITSYFNKQVIIREIETGTVIADWPTQDFCFESTWTPDGRWLAVPASDGRIHIYSQEGWRLDMKLEGSMTGPGVFDPSGEFYLQNGWGQCYGLWRRTQAQPLFKFLAPEPQQIGTDQFGDIFAIEASRGNCHRYELSPGHERCLIRSVRLPLDRHFLNGIAIHPGGRLVVATSSLGPFLWDIATGRELANCFGEFDCQNPVFTADGSLCVKVADAMWRFPQVKRENPNTIYFGSPECVVPIPFEHCSLDRSGKLLGIRVREVANMQPFTGTWLFNLHGSNRGLHLNSGREPSFVNVSPDGRWVASGVGGRCLISDARDGRVIRDWPSGGGEFSADGRLFAQQSEGTTIWQMANEPADWRHVLTLPHAKGPLLFSPDGKTLAVVADLRSVQLFDLNSGSQRARLETHGIVRDVAYSPDSARLVVAHFDNTLSVWNLSQTGTELRRIGLDRGSEPFPEFTKPEFDITAPPLDVIFMGGSIGRGPMAHALSQLTASILSPNPDPLRYVARTFDQLEVHVATEQLFRRITKSHPADAEAGYHLGLCAIEKRDWPAAISHLAVATADPHLHDISHLLRSVVLRQLGRTDEAAAELLLIRAIDGELAPTYWGEATTHFEQSHFGAAALLFDEAIRRDSTDATALRFGALLWCTAPPAWSDPAKALDWAKRSRAIDPARSLTTLVEGLALLQLNRPAEARDMLTALSECGEDIYKTSAQYGLAVAAIHLEQSDVAEQHWRAAEAVWPSLQHDRFPNCAQMLKRLFEDIRRQARPAASPSSMRPRRKTAQ